LIKSVLFMLHAHLSRHRELGLLFRDSYLLHFRQVGRTYRGIWGSCLILLFLAPYLWGASDCNNTTFSNTNITCVQSNNQLQINQTVTLSNAPITFGDSIVVLCRGSNAVTAFSITDATDNINENNTWAPLTPLTAWSTAGSPTLHEQLFWVQSANFIPNSSPPGNQHYRITCNPTGGAGSVSAAAWQFHSPTGIISVDTKSSFQAADNVTGPQSISLTPTQSHDLLFAIVDHTGTMTPGSGFTATDTGPVSEAVGSASSGSSSVSYSLGSSQSTIGFAVAFAQGSYPTTPFISRTQTTDCLNTFPCKIAPTGAGHFLVVGIVNGISGSFSVSGGCATSWVTDSDGGSSTGVSLFHCSNSLGGATSIMMTPSAIIFAAGVTEYSVTPGYTLQLDPGPNAVATTVFTGSTNNPQTAKATTTGANDVVVALVQAANDIQKVMPTPNGFANPITCGCGGAAMTDALNVSAGFNNQATLVIETNQGPGGYGAATVAYEAVPSGGTLPLAPASVSVGSVGGGILACDVNNNGSVNVQDVQLAIDMTLNMSPCTLNLDGPGICNVITIQRVINAALGLSCITGPGVTAHSVSMNWTASTSSNIAGYNVYRGAAAAGPFSKVDATPIAGTSYTDTTVQPGQTYYYVVTAVDSSNNESLHSTPAAQAVVPSS